MLRQAYVEARGHPAESKIEAILPLEAIAQPHAKDGRLQVQLVVAQSGFNIRSDSQIFQIDVQRKCLG